MKYPETRYLSMIVTWVALTNLIEIQRGNVDAVIERAIADGWLQAHYVNGQREISATDKGREKAAWLLDQADPKAAIQ